MEVYNQDLNQPFSLENALTRQQEFITRVYSWMFAALVITGAIAYLTSTSAQIMSFVFETPYVFTGLLIGEVLLVIGLSALINKVSSSVAILLFIIYAAVNGLTMSVIFMVYTQSSIATTFFITAATFGAMSLYGYYTKKDLTSWGNLLFMALIGLIIASVVNLFLKNEMLYWIISYAGVLIFVGLTAYDTQKLKNLNMTNADSETVQKTAIMGALTLYLDFINLFLYLLRLLGRRK